MDDPYKAPGGDIEPPKREEPPPPSRKDDYTQLSLGIAGIGAVILVRQLWWDARFDWHTAILGTLCLVAGLGARRRLREKR